MVGADYMLYGTDAVIPVEGDRNDFWRTDRQLLTEIGASEDQISGILAGNALRFLGEA